MEPLADVKQDLRRRMRLVRSSVADRARRTSRLWADVIELCGVLRDPGDGGLRVMAFVGVGNEPDTSELIDLLLAAGHRVLLPRVEGEHIVAVEHLAGGALRSGAYGIPEPFGPPVEPGTIDVVIVPGLAFTDGGGRLGQGGGFYDRFLALVRDGCITCGVGFAEQVIDEMPLEQHDRPLAMLLIA